MSEAERDLSEPEAEMQSAASTPEPALVSSLPEPVAPLDAPIAAARAAQPVQIKRETLHLQRLAALTAAISATPDDPINYVLRGEVRLALGDLDEAAEDFRRGLLLIAAIGETDWGYLHSLLADRAQHGLRHCSQT
jgi:tetratricopeptide (TPR) repeat protein